MDKNIPQPPHDSWEEMTESYLRDCARILRYNDYSPYLRARQFEQLSSQYWTDTCMMVTNPTIRYQTRYDHDQHIKDLESWLNQEDMLRQERGE